MLKIIWLAYHFFNSCLLLSYAFRKSPYLLRICTEVLTNGMISWICLKIIQGWIREGRGVLIDKTVICHFLIIVRAMWWVYGSSLYFSLYFCIYFKFTVRKKSSGCALATQFFPWKGTHCGPWQKAACLFMFCASPFPLYILLRFQSPYWTPAITTIPLTIVGPFNTTFI